MNHDEIRMVVTLVFVFLIGALCYIVGVDPCVA